VLFKDHISAAKREKTIDTIQTFRNYLHYHIKCSKAYMHDRMRKRCVTMCCRACLPPVSIVSRACCRC
jgi:hypothetical protein